MSGGTVVPTARVRIKGRKQSVMRFLIISLAYTFPWIIMLSQLAHYSKIYGPQVLLQLNIAHYLPSIPVLLIIGHFEKLLDEQLGNTASMAVRLTAGLCGCAALSATYPFISTRLVYLLWLVVGLGSVSSVAFSTSYQLVAWFRSADTIALGIGCVASGPLALVVQIALQIGTTPKRWQWIALFEVAAGVVLVGVVASLSLFWQYWGILSGRVPYEDTSQPLLDQDEQEQQEHVEKEAGEQALMLSRMITMQDPFQGFPYTTTPGMVIPHVRSQHLLRRALSDDWSDWTRGFQHSLAAASASRPRTVGRKSGTAAAAAVRNSARSHLVVTKEHLQQRLLQQQQPVLPLPGSPADSTASSRRSQALAGKLSSKRQQQQQGMLQSGSGGNLPGSPAASSAVAGNHITIGVDPDDGSPAAWWEAMLVEQQSQQQMQAVPSSIYSMPSSIHTSRASSPAPIPGAVAAAAASAVAATASFVGELPLFASDHVTQSDTGELRGLAVLEASSAPAAGGLSSALLSGTSDDPDDLPINTAGPEQDGRARQQEQQHAHMAATIASGAVPATCTSRTGMDQPLESSSTVEQQQQQQQYHDAAAAAAARPPVPPVRTKEQHQQQQQLLASPMKCQGTPFGHGHAGSTASITSLGSAAAAAGGSTGCGSDTHGDTAACTTAGSDEGLDEEGMGQIYWRVFKHTWMVVLAALTSSTLLNCIFPFFTYVESSGLLGEFLPQVLFYTRMLADIMGRLLPRKKALAITAPAALLGLTGALLLCGTAFFVYLQAPPRLQHDPFVLVLVLVLWLGGGYVNTMSYILAPSLVPPKVCTKASALMALCYQIAHILGLVIAVALALALYGDISGSL